MEIPKKHGVEMGSSMNGQEEGLKLGLKMKSISECMAVKQCLSRCHISYSTVWSLDMLHK